VSVHHRGRGKAEQLENGGGDVGEAALGAYSSRLVDLAQRVLVPVAQTASG
jgi:hypothetical protein